MLRSPLVPSALTASWIACVEGGLALGARLADLPAHLRVVGRRERTSTPAVEANDTTPTLTSFGTSARNCLTAERTVPIPVAPIEPLVSMTSIVLRGCCAAGCTATTAGFPPMVTLTDAGSTATASSPRSTKVVLTASFVTRRSLKDAGTVASCRQ